MEASYGNRGTLKSDSKELHNDVDSENFYAKGYRQLCGNRSLFVMRNCPGFLKRSTGAGDNWIIIWRKVKKKVKSKQSIFDF